MHDNGFQEPPFFVAGSIGPRGQIVQVIGEDGEAHSFHVTEALALLECREMREHADGLAIGDGREADGLAIGDLRSPADRPISYGPARSPNAAY